MSIYKEELMDHFKHPRNKTLLNDPDVFIDDGNPSCGDKISVTLNISSDGDKITEIGFTGSGCVLSQASASILYEKMIGKTIDDALSLSKDDLLKLLGLELGPTRLKCAMLSLEVLKKGLLGFKSK